MEKKLLSWSITDLLISNKKQKPNVCLPESLMSWEKDKNGVDGAGGVKEERPKKCETQIPEPVLEKDEKKGKKSFRSSKRRKSFEEKRMEIERERFEFWNSLSKQIKSDKLIAGYPKVLLTRTIFAILTSFTGCRV